MATPALRLTVKSFTDARLQENITAMTRATGRTMKEESTTVLKGMVRDALLYNPPASAGATGSRAKAQGEIAISRDLGRMGFAPKEIKGFRIITKAFGRPIAPVRVKTKENPAFAEPDVYHLERLRSKRGGRVSRGRVQAFYVRKSKFTSMLRRLRSEIGRLASGWIPAARQLGVAIPAWIARHEGSGRGTIVQVIETAHRIVLRVTNRFPDTAGNEAAEMRRRIQKLKEYAIGRLKRQLPHILRKNLRAAKRN